MIHFFYGLAANPLTLAHQKIVHEILDESPENKVYLGLTDHDYKKIELPYQLRERIVRANFRDEISSGRLVILKQDQRTYKFLSSLHDMMDYVLVGTDEWNDLKAGKWHFSAELLRCWKWREVPRTDGVSSTKVRELMKQGVGYSMLKGMISRETYDLAREFWRDSH